MSLLEPDFVASVFGIEIVRMQDLFLRDLRFEVGGLLDRNSRKVYLSTKFGTGYERFTFWHEMGHYFCHKDYLMHRDAPLDGGRPDGGHLSDSKDRASEVEANWFAAGMCMPVSSVQKHFFARFGSLDFHQSDASIFWLGEFGNSVSLARALAKCQSYSDATFDSLNKVFRVSEAAMAYRLQELGLVRQFGQNYVELISPPKFRN